MANWSVSSLRTDHLYVPHEIADIAQRSGLYRMKGLFAPVVRHVPFSDLSESSLHPRVLTRDTLVCRSIPRFVNKVYRWDGFPRLRIP